MCLHLLMHNMYYNVYAGITSIFKFNNNYRACEFNVCIINYKILFAQLH